MMRDVIAPTVLPAKKAISQKSQKFKGTTFKYQMTRKTAQVATCTMQPIRFALRSASVKFEGGVFADPENEGLLRRPAQGGVVPGSPESRI